MHNQIKLVENAIAAISHLGSPYIDAVNDFPSAVVLRPSVSSSQRRASIERRHIGRGTTIDTFTFTVRGYTHTSLETAIDDCEAFARQLEEAIQSVSSPSVIACYVLQVHTDEGLFAPYGICELRCALEWINE